MPDPEPGVDRGVDRCIPEPVKITMTAIFMVERK